MDAYLDILKQREIRPDSHPPAYPESDDAVFERAFSLLDLENELDTVDKSTVSRTINLFLTITLSIVSTTVRVLLKYSVCGNDCNCSVSELHAHFYCLKCHRTFCLLGIFRYRWSNYPVILRWKVSTMY